VEGRFDTLFMLWIFFSLLVIYVIMLSHTVFVVAGFSGVKIVHSRVVMS